MPKTAYINVRVNETLKAKAEKALARVGLTTSDAVTLLLHQIVLRKGLPFEARIPNEETIAAIEELEAGKGETSTAATRDTFDRIAKSRK